MNPDYENILYERHSAQVAAVNAVYGGVDTASDYLQQYNKEDNDTYKDRKEVATLNNFVFRVVSSIKDIVFRQNIDTTKLEGTSVEPYLNSIDYNNSLNSFGKEVLKKLERDGKTYIFVDSPKYGEDIVTKADEEASGLRPYMKSIDRADIPNWKYDDQMRLMRVTLKETYDKGTSEGFDEVLDIQYRVLYYGGIVKVYRDGEIYETIESSFTDIPLVEVGNADIPTLYDLAKLNINHMNRGSELNNYIRIGAAPIPVTWGLNTTEGETTVIGVNQGINFSGPKDETGFEWVEMSGKNAEMIRNQIKDDEESMLDITVSIVTSNQPRTATEVNSDNIENESRLVSSAMALEAGLNKALEFFVSYQNSELKEDQMCIVNKDFDSNKLTDEEVKDYRADYLAGIISWDKLIDVLTLGKRYPEMSEDEKITEKANLVDPSGL